MNKEKILTIIEKISVLNGLVMDLSSDIKTEDLTIMEDVNRITVLSVMISDYLNEIEKDG